MDYHYSDLYDRDEGLKREQPESNGTLATRIAELTRQLSTLQRDFDLMKADRDRLLDEMAKRWPDTKRIDAIGQNGNTGEHYAPVLYEYGGKIFHTLETAELTRKLYREKYGLQDLMIYPLHRGEPI